MIVALLNTYIVLLALFVWLGFVPFNLFWKISRVIVLLLLVVGVFIPMGWGAPSGPAVVMRHSVQIAPEVAGEVLDVPVEPNIPLKAGDVLFRIDPTPYEAQVRTLDAQLAFANLRLAQFSRLQRSEAGRAFDVEQRQTEVEKLKAQLTAARWNLDKTVVRAPADGFVTNVVLRKGARVGTTPVMAFIETSDTLFGMEVPQIYARYIEAGQPVEATFKLYPGRVYAGRVETVLQAVSTGQAQPTGFAVAPPDVQSAPFVIRIRLDDRNFAGQLPAGSTALAAIFTDRVKVAHVVRKVILRQVAILNYINPF